ncbi:MAG: DUF2953 domain-containing protein [Peptococcaceae bacterium]|nr:DUF2953 domain-containing protein [Peptococcaceae bacterium]
MEITICLLAGLALLTAVIMAAPVELRVRYGREGEKDILAMELFLWPGIRYRYRAVMIDFKAYLSKSILGLRGGTVRGGTQRASMELKRYRGPGIKEMIGQSFFWRDVYRDIRPAVIFLKRRLKLYDLAWETRCGFDDPFYTGLATGIIWSFKGYLALLICSHIKALTRPVLGVFPDFNRAGLAVRLSFRIASRTGYIVLTGLWMSFRLLATGRAGRIIKMIRGKRRAEKKQP